MMYSIIRNFTKIFKMGMYDYSQLEGPDLIDGEDTCYRLVTKDGGFITFFEVRGSYSYAGAKAFEKDLSLLISRIEGILKKPGFHLELLFLRDPENGYESIRQSITSSQATAKRLGLDVGELLNERKTTLSKKLSLERCYLVLQTDSAIFPPTQVAQAFKDRTESMKGSGIGIKPGEFSQSPLVAIKAIRDSHNALVRTVSLALSEKISIKRLDAHQAVQAIALCMGVSSKNPLKWSPKLLGDKIQPRELKESGYLNDISHLMPMDIAMQLFDKHPSVCDEDPSIVKYGETYIAPLTCDIPPQNAQRLNTLLENIDETIPWLIKIRIDSGHGLALSKTSSKNGWASFLSFSSSENNLIRDSAEELMSRASTETLCMAGITFSTWGNSVKEVTKRKAIYMQSLQGWGGMEVIEEAGDPIHGWCNSLPGFSNSHIANRFPTSLNEILRLAPIERPSSPWETGPLLFSTLDGKAYPYWPGSGKQTASSSIYYAPPGFGKSFSLAAANMGLLLSPGLSELPFLVILDIGYSSRAFVELVKSMLPADKKHQALAISYEMTPEYAFNPFDTPLGSRRPMSVDRSFLLNFLTLVLTPASSKTEIPRLSELIGALVDAMYEYYSDENSPHNYDKGIDLEIDKSLDDYSFYPDQETSWWEITDFFASKKLYRLAATAQKYAVPTLNDATAVLSSDSGIQELYKNVNHNGEPILKFITSMIITVIRDLPILSQPTAFDMGDARVVSIDLSSVAQQGSAQADKQTAVMYMLARQMTCKEFYRGKNLLTQVSDDYYDYHKGRIDLISSLPKKICMDELHRTSNSPAVRAQAKIDLREGRKFEVMIDLLSQMLDDFDEDMIRLVNNVYILSRGNSEDDLEQLRQKFKPSDDAMDTARRVLTGPGPQGNTMLYFGTLKGEKSPLVEMFLRLQLGSSEVWAYSTTPQDVRLRTLLSDRIGLSQALRILGKAYPGGSAKNDIQTMMLDDSLGGGDKIFEKLVNTLSSQVDKIR